MIQFTAHKIIENLLELRDHAGHQSRLAALAVVLSRAGVINPDVVRLAEEEGGSLPRLHDLAGALRRWQVVDAKLSEQQRDALQYATVVLDLMAVEMKVGEAQVTQ